MGIKQLALAYTVYVDQASMSRQEANDQTLYNQEKCFR